MKIDYFVKSLDWFTNTRGMRGSFGWGNGYILLPKDHPCFGMEYSDIYENYPNTSFNVEITFSRSSFDVLDWDELPQEARVNEHWVVGFDTMHWGDTEEKWPKSKVESESAKMAFTFFEIWLIKEREKNK